jgi:calcineurin-like phosphoesterase family protein
MFNTFFISDTHFGHKNSLSFLRSDGVTKLRHFSSVEEMDETMVKNWNEKVSPKSKVYHLGDVAMSHKELPILGRLNGEKILIKGNHDTGKLSQYMKYFKDVRGSHQIDKLLLTHIPVHRLSIGKHRANIHGHTHDNIVRHEFPPYEHDEAYLCVCVEQINYTPISLAEINEILKNRS